MILAAEINRILTAEVAEQAGGYRTPVVQKYKFISSVNINLTYGIAGDVYFRLSERFLQHSNSVS
jgi:hypothetical protein